MSCSNKMRDKNSRPDKIVFRFIKMYKIEIMLIIMTILSVSAYIFINVKNDRIERKLTQESKRVYSVAVDIDSDSDDLINTLYNEYYTVNKDIYFKYQIKNIGDTVGYYEIADTILNNRIEGRINLTVTDVEKPEECSLIEKVPGGAFIKLTVKLENLMAEDCIVCMNGLRFLIMDNDGYEVLNSDYELEYSGLGPKFEECGDKLDCYSYLFGNDGSGKYVPAELNSYRIQYLLIEKGESITFNMYCEIPQKIVDDSRLVFSNGAALRNCEYNSRGFSIYINRQSEE